ncbi:hypothetical protein CHLNCDRAFT_134945 [Chlorella variabilis]|uniref:Uncharacterized protein n=1 Tax=Chlorella variabilis TaxID=554065 RepID=E1ZH66_CHLVA|nr:hypothetical protein CHLNCDRAFT_134945 [Chlorella variabilis]EFN54867.1 hypothetical protein CHLNCDRAFT_134945 [Chlorella variabilis]|eukprot:XP_005846969.1 hypothetical protein CHLNCDRAFT_134945 [Chlorella variabilis]
MAQLESDELEQLMPNIEHRVRQQSSPANTGALREYIRVLGEKPVNVPAGSTVPQKPRTDGLQTRAGSGRRPQRRYFTIKWRVEPEPEPQEQVEVDPEALKDALLEQAKAQRRALMEAALRPGTGRFPRSREFAITLLPLQLEEQEEELLEEAGADQLLQQDMEWQAAGEAGDEQLLEYGEHEEQAWEVEEGVLAEQQARAAVQPAAADAPASTAATPGAALLRQQDGQPQSGGLQQERPDSQRGQAKTPATSLFGRYTPMEGVPERLALLATRGKQPPATVSRSARPARTPAGFTPTEGIPERLLAFQPPLGGPRPLGLPGATLVCSNQAQRSVDSPVEGLVQQGVRRSKDGAAVPQPTDADAGFAGFAQPSPRQQEAEQQLAEEEQQQHEEQGVADDDDNGDFGFADDGGYYDEDGAPSPSAPQAAGTGSFPFLAGRSPAHMEDACVQTGASLGAEERAAAEAAAPAAEADNEGAYGGYDAGGDYDALDVHGQEPSFDADLPEPSAAARQRVRRKATKDPGVRLRNELKRKSLAVDPTIGRREVLPGVRRSCRSRQGPLKWWLNERQEFGRQHQTMPTVRNVVHKVPNTPWQTVTDIRRRPAKRQRAPTPHDLDEMLGGAADEEQGWEAEEEEVVQEEQPDVEEEQEEQVADDAAEPAATEEQHEVEQQQGRRQSSRRQQAAAQPMSRRQGKAPAARVPAAKGKAMKKKAAGSKRRGRR